jgi:hypothetical protein
LDLVHLVELCQANFCVGTCDGIYYHHVLVMLLCMFSAL